MLQMTNRRIAIAAAVLAAVLALVVYQYLSGMVEARDTGPQVEVVIAVQDIPADTRITRSMLATRQIPQDYAHDDAFRSIDDVVGGITKTQVLAREQMLQARIHTDDSRGAKFSYRIPDDMRAMSIAVSEVVSVSGLVDVGDRVDLLVTYTPQGASEAVTRTLLQRLEVLATGGTIDERDDGQQLLTSAVTLAVTPEQGQLIRMAETEGTFRLMLRNPSDQNDVSIQPISASNLDTGS